MNLKFGSCLLLATLSLPRAFAQAPDSLADKYFHDSGSQVSSSNGTHWIRLAVLRADGSCGFIMENWAEAGAQPDGKPVRSPAGDGSWYYRKIYLNQGILYVSGQTNRGFFRLTFTSPTSGSFYGSNEAGERTTSGPEGNFTLTDQATNDAAPLLNASLRGNVSPGRTLIAGFVVPGTTRRDLLIRVVGPSLAPFGVTGTWADPEFKLSPANGPINRNYLTYYYGDWSTSALVVPNRGNPLFPEVISSIEGFKKIFSACGAFPLVDGSKDAVQVVNLAPGAYTVLCTTGAGDAGGEALIEIYSLP